MIWPCCRSIPGWQGMEKIPSPQRRRTVSWWPWLMRTLTMWSNMCQSWTLWSVSRGQRKSLSPHHSCNFTWIFNFHVYIGIESKSPLKIFHHASPIPCLRPCWKCVYIIAVWFNSEDIRVLQVQTCIDHTLLVLYDSFVSHTLKSMQCHVVHFVLNILIKMFFFNHYLSVFIAIHLPTG